mgnify:CR=1 FL=1
MSEQETQKSAVPRVSLTPEEFVLRGLQTLVGKTKGGKPHKGFHSVWSGFNAAFKKLYPDVDHVALQKRMEAEGKIVIQPWKGGVLICPPGTVKRLPSDKDKAVASTLEQMGVAAE